MAIDVRIETTGTVLASLVNYSTHGTEPLIKASWLTASLRSLFLEKAQDVFLWGTAVTFDTLEVTDTSESVQKWYQVLKIVCAEAVPRFYDGRGWHCAVIRLHLQTDKAERALTGLILRSNR